MYLLSDVSKLSETRMNHIIKESILRKSTIKFIRFISYVNLYISSGDNGMDGVHLDKATYIYLYLYIQNYFFDIELNPYYFKYLKFNFKSRNYIIDTIKNITDYSEYFSKKYNIHYIIAILLLYDSHKLTNEISSKALKIEVYTILMNYIESTQIHNIEKFYLEYEYKIKILSNKFKDRYEKYPSNTVYIFDINLLNNGYFVISKLGEGAYSNVFHIKKIGENRNYAAKRCVKHADNEIEILKLIVERLPDSYPLYFSKYETDYCYNIKGTTYTYILTEYLDGFDCGADIINWKLNAVVNEIFKNIINGLVTLHSINIYHNDIKLDNLMVNLVNGMIKYIDFGGACRDQLTCRKLKSFTDDYVSPERYTYLTYHNQDILKTLDYTELCRLSDIWSVGIIFYKILTGSFPIYYSLNNEYLIYDFLKDPNRKIIKNKLDGYPESHLTIDDMDAMLNKKILLRKLNPK